MANRRMFSQTIIDSDAFLDMPLSTQALYFHLSMRADDEGFINNPNKICRMIGAGIDELKLLTAKRFIIQFQSGVVVIKHWLIHNMIRKDRMKQTLHSEEKAQIKVKDNDIYTESLVMLDTTMVALGQPNDNQMSAQDRLGKDRLGEVSIGKIIEKKPTQKQVFSDIVINYTSNLVLVDTIESFIDMRKSIKAKLTEHALKLTLSKLDKMTTDDQDKIEILNQSIMNSWKGIFPLKNNSITTDINTKMDNIKENIQSGFLSKYMEED